jgi:cyclopropane fatty-acyl-phospholipid synthase-like methyltransferase
MKIKSPLPAAAFGLFFIALGDPPPEWTRDEIPFVPTPVEVVDRMLELAEVTKNDVVYDLGSGDGRIVIRAAKKYGARSVGYEVDVELVEASRKRAAEEGVSHLVEIRAEDALTADVSNATVVTLYMLPWFNEKIRPVLQQKLRPGSRVVSHDFEIPGWDPAKVVEFEKEERLPGGRLHRHRILLWKIEEKPRSP